MCKELGNLLQFSKDTERTDTVKFITPQVVTTIPKIRVVAYAWIVVEYIDDKEDPNKARLTAGENLIQYPYKLTTYKLYITTKQIMWNTVISILGAK